MRALNGVCGQARDLASVVSESCGCFRFQVFMLQGLGILGFRDSGSFEIVAGGGGGVGCGEGIGQIEGFAT